MKWTTRYKTGGKRQVHYLRHYVLNCFE